MPSDIASVFRNRIPGLAAILLLFVLGACANTSSNLADGVSSLPPASKVILMPIDIELGVINAGGIVEPRADWTETARGHLHQSLDALLDEAGVDLIVRDTPDPYADLDETEIQLVKLHGALGKTILVHQYIPPFKLPSRPEGFDWTLGTDVRSLKQQFDAQYALFVFMRDTYSSSGRAAVVALGILFGVHVPGGQQVGFASLVDLESGRVVWFNRLISGTGDLRTAEAARTSAESLVAGFPRR